MPEEKYPSGSDAAGWGRFVASAVAPGVWASAIPFPSPLAYSYSYASSSADGVVLVDLGWNSDEAWERLQAGLIRGGFTLSDVRGVVVSHAHPDHYGLAARIKEHTDAWIAMHEAEGVLISASHGDRLNRVAEIADWLRECGVPSSELDDLDHDAARLVAGMAGTEPDFTLADGEVVPCTGGSMVAVHTPGHTPGHLCFRDRERRLLYTGDHLLPRVTPNISERPRNGEKPLADYRASLRTVAVMEEPVLVLPGHEWAFDRPARRAAAIEGHHVARLSEIRAAVDNGASTAWEVTAAISWSREFVTFNSAARRQALGEAVSHLAWLADAGQIRSVSGVPRRWISAG